MAGMIRVDAINTAATGIAASVAQLNATAHNLANVQSTTPMDETAFQGERPLFAEHPSGGVRVSDVVPAGTEEGIPAYQPDNPQADASGFVRLPDLDIAGEMVNLVVAEQAVAANVVTINRAVDSYRDLLSMTNRDRSHQAAAAVSL